MGRPGTSPMKRKGGRTELPIQRFACDVLHNQEGSVLFVDSYVVQLDDARIGKLADDLCFAEELLLEAFAETVQKGFDRDGAANDVVPRFFDAARGAGTEVSESLVAVLLQRNHYAERSRRAARSRRPLPLVCGGVWGMTLWPADGYGSSARASAEVSRRDGSFAS